MIRPSYYVKRFGQNFLKDINIAKKIVYLAMIQNEIVLEIGAGKGILTRELAKKARMVFAIEIDKKLVEILKNRNLTNVVVINCDFLKIDLKVFLNPTIIGNIPYSITTPILEKLVEQKEFFQRAVLTIQKEYGERLLASPGASAYGSITLFINYHFNVKKISLIPAKYFSPKPKVSSMVISVEKKDPPFQLGNLEEFFDFIKGVFRYRRKFLKNALINYLNQLPHGIDKELLHKRPQELSLDDFRKIYLNTQHR